MLKRKPLTALRAGNSVPAGGSSVAVIKRVASSVVCCAAMWACASAADKAAAPSVHYVAMGSSFASGPGIAPSAGSAPLRCGRSAGNYAQQLAALRGLQVTDVTCSGARTRHVLGPWGDVPAQLEALRPDTRLVTITIGGNDVGYIGGLLNASCAAVAAADPVATSPPKCRPVTAPTQADYDGLEARFMDIAAQVKARSPRAVVVFVTYMTVLPPQGICAATPLPPGQAQASRVIASRLVTLTAKVAQKTGAMLVDGAAITRDHHACADDPWMQGYAANADWKTTVPYHPTRAGMTAIAKALDEQLPR